MKILLIGGTGRLGQVFVKLAPAGAEIRIASRRPRPQMTPKFLDWAQLDLATGTGLRKGLEGIDTVIFAAAGDPKNHAAVEVNGMKLLLEAAQETGVRHLIYVSIVGIDRLPVSYYRTKLAAEDAIEASGVPYSILRATQFHDFVEQMLKGLARCPLFIPVPRGFRVQPVATKDVAARLVQGVFEGPKGRLPDFGGPEVLSLKRAAELWKEARGIRKPICEVPLPGKTAAAFRRGYNTAPHGEHGTVCWSTWLARERRPG